MPKLRSNNIDLYYEVQGAGQPLVFINGLGSSTRDWVDQVQEFCKSYRVITFDLRGQGKSDAPAGPYTIPMFALDIVGLLKGLGIESAHIVGISLGGGIAFQLALDTPAVVKTLVIVNSGPLMTAPGGDAQKEIDSRIGIVKQMGMRAMGQALAPNLFPKPEHAALREDFINRWAENNPQAYIETLLSMVGWNVMSQIGSIRCPTLVISSDHDYSPVALKEAYIKLMPDAQLVVIPDAHHAVPIERPREFNAVLAKFLAEHP